MYISALHQRTQYRVSTSLHRNWPILPQVPQVPVPVRTGNRWKLGQEDSMNNKVIVIEENKVMDHDKNTEGEKQR